MDEKQIIELYFARSERAITETDRKYGRLCYGIAFHILDSREDSEECVSDTYLRTWNAIPPNRPNRLAAFLARITRNLALNRYARYSAEKRGGGEVPLALEELAECVPAPDRVERKAEEVFLKDVLNRFLGELQPETRRIFLRRYWNLSPVSEIAEFYGISESKVKTSLFRTRGKLRSFLQKEGITL